MNTLKILIALWFLGSGVLSAQTTAEAVNMMENENGVGAKAQAMGNAFNAVADDYTAVYWNPAGLTQLDDHQLYGELYHLQFNNESSYLGNTLLDDRNFTKFSSLGLAYKFPTTRGSFVISLGYNRFKDFDDFLSFSGFSSRDNGLEFALDEIDDELIYYPYNQDVFREEQVSQEGNLGAWSVGGGVQLSPNFSLGLTMNFYSGSSLYLFDFFQDDIDNNYSEFPANYDGYELHQKIDTDFTGWGVKLGSLFNLNENIRFGLTVDFPRTLHVQERYHENDVLFFDDGFVSETESDPGEWEYLIKYPFKFGGGAALDLDMFVLAGSFEYNDWTQVEYDIPDGFSLTQDYADLLEENKYFATEYRAVWSYSVGGEFRIPGTSLRLRGGYRYVPAPFNDVDDEFNRKYFSTGFGYNIDKKAEINFSYTRGYWKRDTFDQYTPGGTLEDIETTRLLAGITYRF